MKFRSNKYSARRTWSELCGRFFDSKAEAKRGEELVLLEKAGKIKGLEYQQSFELCRKPKISIKIDFAYEQDGKMVYEDVKGYRETREFRVKRAWLAEKYGIKVVLTNGY
jgi:hypothetical protein